MKNNALIRKLRAALREIEQGCIGRQGVTMQPCDDSRYVPRRHLGTVLRRYMRQYAAA